MQKFLGFIHPVTEEELLLKAPLPRDIVEVMNGLRRVTTQAEKPSL